MNSPSIRTENLVYRYPFCDRISLEGVSFSLAPGEVLLVTGASGCGKSTLLRILNGLIPDHYKGHLEGRADVAGRVGTVLQNPEEQILATTVEEEVALALEWRSVPQPELRARVDAALEDFGLATLARRSVFKLSSGERQKCVLASVVAAGREIFVMDEPTANLSPEATEELAQTVGKLKTQGKTVVIVDHRLYWLHGVVDRVLVLKEGRPVFLSSPEDGSDPLAALAAAPQFADWGLRAVDVTRPDLPEVPADAPAAVEVTGLDFRYGRKLPWLYRHFSARLPRRAVTAVVGANGAGKTTLARLLCGLLKPTAGEIRFGGERKTRRYFREHAAFAMQQMDIQLYMRSVEEELLFSAPRGVPKAERVAAAEKLLAQFGLAGLKARHPQSLSGGEKQRLVVACALMKRPEILVLDEPTSGLDGRNMGVIAAALNDYAAQGGCALLITHDLELLGRVASYRLTIASPEN